MNELRMYVEHLFEGKVLSADVIELKEEVYGNLVARYEDYLAQGMGAEEALASTKASLTSIDDLLEDGIVVQGEAVVGDGAPSESDLATDAETMDSVGPAAADDAPAAETRVLDAADAGVAATEGLPVPPAGAPSEAADAGDAPAVVSGKASPMKWALVALAFFVALVLLGLGFRACAGLVRYEDADVDVTDSSVSFDDGRGNSVQVGPDGDVVVSRGEDAVMVDENGAVTFEGQVADEVVTSVVDATPADIADFANAEPSDAVAVEGLVRALPMAAWAQDVDVTKGVDVLSLAYREIPDTFEDDSVEVALAYNAAAIFCAMPKVNEVRVIVTESEEPLEEAAYAFERTRVQQAFGCMLSPELINEAGWVQLKEDHLYGYRFAERVLEAAELK